MKKYLLPKEGRFYKANLHSHSNLSDGNLSPQEMKEVYKAHGYSVLAYTDHDIFIPHHDLTDESFLALSGFEVEIHEKNAYPGLPDHKTCHICFIAGKSDMDIQPCWNVEHAYAGNAKKNAALVKFDENEPPFQRDYSPEGVNLMIKKCREAGFFVTYNHPVWSQENFEIYTKYEGMHAMEILNHACYMMGYPSYVPTIYDDMLRSGKKIFAVAADDCHSVEDSCGGFVMIKAEKLSYETITDALFAGDFYASNGPEIYDLYVEDGMIHITCSDAAMITLNTGRRKAEAVIAKDGQMLTEAVFPVEEKDIYVRISVKDASGNYADTSAYFTEDILN